MSDREYTYEELRTIIDKHLSDFLPEVDQNSMTIYDSMKYSLTAGGKRLRPVLLLAACDFAGSNSLWSRCSSASISDLPRASPRARRFPVKRAGGRRAFNWKPARSRKSGRPGVEAPVPVRRAQCEELGGSAQS